MSRKPYIKIVYPDASSVAMLLTEAMVRRASGKRVVETESTERESTGQELFSGTLACITETSVELTLNLNSDAMDYALAQLIAKNLTQSEREQAMAASDSLELDKLLSPAQAAEAAGGACTAEVGSAERAADGAPTQSGEQKDIEKPASGDYVALCLASALIAALKCGYKKKNVGEMKSFVDDIIEDILIGNPNDLNEIEIPGHLLKTYLERKDTICLPDDLDDLPGVIKNVKTPSWEDVEAEARTIGQNKTNKSDKTDEADGEIDAGLLNDIDTEGEDHAE